MKDEKWDARFRLLYFLLVMAMAVRRRRRQNDGAVIVDENSGDKGERIELYAACGIFCWDESVTDLASAGRWIVV